MHQLIKKLTVAVVIIFATQANAFSDKQTLEQINNLRIKSAATQNMRERQILLENLKLFMFQKLSTMELPDLMTVSMQDPRIEEYRSLTEFDNYISMINVKNLNKENCANEANRIEAAQSNTEEVTRGVEAKLALLILGSLCK